jgi:hypothetical protein
MLHLHVAPPTFHKPTIMKQAYWSMLHTHVYKGINEMNDAHAYEMQV